jgi:hypothetical protein
MRGMVLQLPKSVLLCCLMWACASHDSGSTANGPATSAPDSSSHSADPDTINTVDATPRADVVGVQVTGDSGRYTFAVTVASPDSGCGQYADWWEVIGAEGSLLYRRVLLHSHVTEQPFLRSGGPVPVAATDSVWVRAHMNETGYGGQAYAGSVADGWAPASPTPVFAEELEHATPLPQNCSF